jgi:hypothetical protein
LEIRSCSEAGLTHGAFAAEEQNPHTSIVYAVVFSRSLWWSGMVVFLVQSIVNETGNHPGAE